MASLCLKKNGFDVYGIDNDSKKVDRMKAGKFPDRDVARLIINPAIDSNQFQIFQNYDVLSHADCIIICVPTPLRQTKDPDMQYILQAVSEIKKYLTQNMLVVLESTTYPGTTKEVLLAEFENKNLKAGKDFFLAFSPERVDPGNSQYGTKNTPKIVGGITSKCTDMATSLYEKIVDKVVPVSSSSTAEMVKLLENTFRAVNIGLVNEIAIACNKLEIPVWEVIEAAATKPFGFMPFFPGPGLGGHCIPIDPLYLSWKLKTLNYKARFIELASEINAYMPEYCLIRISKLLSKNNQLIFGADILVLGVSYKKDVGDVRESPAIDIIQLLEQDGAKVDYYDPYVPSLKVNKNLFKKSIQLTPKSIKNYCLVILVTNHSCFDYEMIKNSAHLIFDTRNSFKESFETLCRL